MGQYPCATFPCRDFPSNRVVPLFSFFAIANGLLISYNPMLLSRPQSGDSYQRRRRCGSAEPA